VVPPTRNVEFGFRFAWETFWSPTNVPAVAVWFLRTTDPFAISTEQWPLRTNGSVRTREASSLHPIV
jgi:hypothetical protein